MGAAAGGVGGWRVVGLEPAGRGRLRRGGGGDLPAMLRNERCDGVGERGQALAGDGGDLIEGQLAAFGHGAELLELVGIGDVDLGGDEDGGLGGECGIEAGELGGDDLVVLNGVGAGVALGGGATVGDVDEVDDDAGALNVAEELDAEAGAEVRALDEAGEVGDGEGFLVGEVTDGDDAEVGLKGGEGVVGDFGPGGGEARDEG